MKKIFDRIISLMLCIFTIIGIVACSNAVTDSSSNIDNSHIHTLEYTAGKAPSCKQIGFLEYWYCTDCKEYFADEACTKSISMDELWLEKTSHKLTRYERVEPTETQEGNIEYWQCNDCKEYFVDEDGTVKISQEQTLVVSPYKLCDFIVEVEEGRDIVVLQLSDPQIIDAAQKRSANRLTAEAEAYWATDKIEERCYGYMRETIQATNPDFIFITGDLIYGEFDDKGTSWLSLIAFMESFCIPWAPIFGNHDNESAKGVEWQCEQLENAEYCLFKKGEVNGNGNYTVGIMQGGKLKRAFVMLDTHGCLRNAGLAQDQVQWFTEEVTKINNSTQDCKISFAMHIQPIIFKDAYAKYGFTNSGTSSNPINIDTVENAAESDFGYIGANLKNPWDADYRIWDTIKGLGVDSIFVGHEHANSASVVYQGVRFQFGQKASTYDRANYVTEDGKIICSYSEAGDPLVGGSVFSISQTTGEIINPYIYLCN